MLTVANPIYDIVFKYLMEDERIAKTILSALLKKNVVELEFRKHEYSDMSRDKISMFRIDFAATIEESDGSRHLVLIELQKTWIETETLRFRQYLGAHYSNKENICRDDGNGYAIPMIAVYILGHRLGDIEEPVLYVHGKAYDYDGNEVTKGMPDPFVESLNHDTIFVQIPLLKGRFNNRLEQVLSVFDQSRKSVNPQELRIDEQQYEGDSEMMVIVHRLMAAASDSQMRRHMNVEDEYFSAIEDRDTAIMIRDKKLAEQRDLLAESEKQLAESEKQLAESEKQLAESEKQLAENEKQLAENEKQLAENEKQLAESEKQLAESEKQLAEKDELLAEQRAALLNSARLMLAGGVAAEKIMEITKLSIEEIEKL